MKKKRNHRDDKLARMIQRGFEQTATKGDLLSLKEDVSALKEDVIILRKDTEAGFRSVVETMKAMQEEIKDLKGIDVKLPLSAFAWPAWNAGRD